MGGFLCWSYWAVYQNTQNGGLELESVQVNKAPLTQQRREAPRFGARVAVAGLWVVPSVPGSVRKISVRPAEIPSDPPVSSRCTWGRGRIHLMLL